MDYTSRNLSVSGFRYSHSGLSNSHDFLLPAILGLLRSLKLPIEDRRLFEVGCGNGSLANELSRNGWNVTGVDPSEEGIQLARSNYPDLKLTNGSAYDDLAGKYGQFPVVLSLEVVEHVYDPRHYARTVFELLEPGGTTFLSTPYHGYWKNLALALSGQMDKHFTALWDHGHIKFWSIETLSQLLSETGFVNLRFERVGRIPPLAKSMIAIARKP